LFDRNTSAASNAMKKMSVSLIDSTELRVILGVLYIMTEVLRNHPDHNIRENFAAELSMSVIINFMNIYAPLLFHYELRLSSTQLRMYLRSLSSSDVPFDDDLLAIRLLAMVTRFCSGSAPHFPMKKVLLLLWKVLLTSLGGMETLRILKQERRTKAGLPEVEEDTLTVSRQMRAASPPANAADILEATNNRRNNRPGIKRSMMTKQSSLDDVGLDMDGENDDDDGFEDASSSSAEEKGSDQSSEEPFPGGDSPRPGTPVPVKSMNGFGQFITEVIMYRTAFLVYHIML
jgi:hypothetical protein